VQGQELAAGTFGGGVWKRPLEEIVTSVSSMADPLPDEVFLEQNFPNPFNPATRIIFSLPRAGQVSLKVYNCLGEIITTLLEGERPAGTHRVEWNATNVPSGVYFYQLSSGGRVITRTMGLIR
jgi:hypothetical protein